MSLVRSFTTRRQKGTGEGNMLLNFGRTSSHRVGKGVNRAQISSPLALVSTSNVMLNNAQHIAGTAEIHFRPESPSSPGGSSSSGEESDGSANSIRTGYTMTDASSVDESPSENHLSCYFKPAVDTLPTQSIRDTHSSMRSTLSDTPSVPSRQPSHSKRAHESLHRQRSIRRMMSPPPDSAREMSRTSFEQSGSVEALRESPFGSELAQLDEIAEEFGHAVRDAEASQDNVVMQSHGLATFTASDYLREIQGLLNDTFGAAAAPCAQWI